MSKQKCTQVCSDEKQEDRIVTQECSKVFMKMSRLSGFVRVMYVLVPFLSKLE